MKAKKAKALLRRLFSREVTGVDGKKIEVRAKEIDIFDEHFKENFYAASKKGYSTLSADFKHLIHRDDVSMVYPGVIVKKRKMDEYHLASGTVSVFNPSLFKGKSSNEVLHGRIGQCTKDLINGTCMSLADHRNFPCGETALVTYRDKIYTNDNGIVSGIDFTVLPFGPLAPFVAAMLYSNPGFNLATSSCMLEKWNDGLRHRLISEVFSFDANIGYEDMGANTWVYQAAYPIEWERITSCIAPYVNSETEVMSAKGDRLGTRVDIIRAGKYYLKRHEHLDRSGFDDFHDHMWEIHSENRSISLDLRTTTFTEGIAAKRLKEEDERYRENAERLRSIRFRSQIPYPKLFWGALLENA